MPVSNAFPIRFWMRLSLVFSFGGLLGFVALRWFFWRDLGSEYAKAFYVIDGMLDYLVPTLILSLLLVVVIASVAVFIVAILGSHRVAGPLFRLQRVGGYLENKILIGHIFLRSADWIKPVANAINDWVLKRKVKQVELVAHAKDIETALLQVKIAFLAMDHSLMRKKLADLSVYEGKL
jgi:hypothetical protein